MTKYENREIIDDLGNRNVEKVPVTIGSDLTLHKTPDGTQVKFIRFAAAAGTKNGLQRQIEILAQICPMKNDRNVRNIRIVTLIQDLFDAGASEFVVAMKAREYRQTKGNVFFPNHSDFYNDCVNTTRNFMALYESIINPKPLLDKPMEPNPKPKRETPWNDKTDEEKAEVIDDYKKNIVGHALESSLRNLFLRMHQIPEDVDFNALL